MFHILHHKDKQLQTSRTFWTSTQKINQIKLPKTHNLKNKILNWEQGEFQFFHELLLAPLASLNQWRIQSTILEEKLQKFLKLKSFYFSHTLEILSKFLMGWLLKFSKLMTFFQVKNTIFSQFFPFERGRNSSLPLPNTPLPRIRNS